MLYIVYNLEFLNFHSLFSVHYIVGAVQVALPKDPLLAPSPAHSPLCCYCSAAAFGQKFRSIF